VSRLLLILVTVTSLAVPLAGASEKGLAAPSLGDPVALARVAVAAGDPQLSTDDITVTEGDAGSVTADFAVSLGLGEIVDGDPLPQVSIGDASVIERNTGQANARFTVSLSPASGQTVTVDYATADGTAVAEVDYRARAGVVTFLPGETSQMVNVPVIGDTIDEPDETFAVDLSNAVNASIADGEGAGTIADDDTAPSLSIDDATVNEGGSGSSPMTFTVSLAGQSDRTVSVGYATADDTATAPGDYTSTSGTLSFAPGETSKTVTVPVAGDTLDEPDETFAVDLADAVDASIADGEGVGTIVDDDEPLPPGAGPAISVGNVRVTEGDSDTTPATFKVSLSRPSAQDVAVGYATVDGTAVADTDYVATTGRLVVPAGETASTVTVPVRGDTVRERRETFSLVLSNPSAGADIAAGAGIGTIMDDDSRGRHTPVALSAALHTLFWLR
jgi:hypothetical protein